MTTIAILYPGEMGSAFAALLTAAGHRVGSPLGERSERTRAQAAKAGVETLGSMREAVEAAEIVLSLVPPDAVHAVADAVIRVCGEAGTCPTFIDLNAKTPSDARRMAERFEAAKLPFVNACIIGRAAHLADEGRIFASGPDLGRLEALFEGILPVTGLGEAVETASAFKMCFAGFNKTVAAALFETANTANAFAIGTPIFELIGHHLGGTLADMGKLVPGYPRHIARRGEEMTSLARMLDEAGLPNAVAAAASRTFRAIASQDAMRPAETRRTMADILSELRFQVPAA